MNRQYVNDHDTELTTVWHVIAWSLLVLLALGWALVPMVSADDNTHGFEGGAVLGVPGEQTRNEAAVFSAGSMVEDTVGYWFTSSTEGWQFLNPANQVQEYWPNTSCVEVWDVFTVPYTFGVSQASFSGEQTLKYDCEFHGYYNTSCDYEWWVKSVVSPTDASWNDVHRIEARVYKNFSADMWAMIGVKHSGANSFEYFGWPGVLTDYGWHNLSLDEPYSGAFYDVEAVSIICGAYSAAGSLYIDFVRGLKEVVPVPVLVSPADGATIEDNAPLFRWEPSEGAAAYDFQVDDDPTFSSPLIWQSWYYGTEYDSSYIPNGTYYWRAAAWDPTEEWSGWSAANKFTITGSYRVPSEFPTIQAAVNAIPYFNGGEVLVAPGTYTGVGNRNIRGFGDKSVQVRSESGAASTTIDCQNADRAFYFDLYAGAGTVVEGFTIRNATDGAATTGGAIQCVGGWPTIQNCVFEYCSQGGVYAANGATPTLNGCNFRYNDYWGVYANNGGNFDIDGCNFFQNRSEGLGLYQATNTTVSNSTFSNSYGYEGEGVGADISYSTATFDGCTFQSNESHGVYTYNSTTTFIDCDFENNQGFSYGGGIYASGSSGAGHSTTILNSTFEGNNGYYGGAIYTYNTQVNAYQTLFDGNVAEQYGGAVYVNWGSTFSPAGCTFVNNSAPTGSAIYIETEPVAASENDNPSGRPSRPSEQSLGGAMVSECLLAYNLQSAPIYLETYAWIEITCTDIYGNAGGNWTGAIAPYLGQNGNISAKPLFCDAAGGNFTVAANSPVADANTGCKTIGAYDVGCAAVQIGLDPTSFAFTATVESGNPAAQNLTISNLGGSVLNWNMSNKSNWLQASSYSGAAPSTVSISVNKTGLLSGVYHDTLVITCPDAVNSPQRVPVTLTITSAEIAVDPTLLYFEAQFGDPTLPADQTISISNVGSGDLAGELSHGQSWLELSTPLYTAPAEVTVSVDHSSLTPGTWLDTIVITSDGALNSPQYVGVTLTISDVDAPTLDIVSSSHPVTGTDTARVNVNAGDDLSIGFAATTPLPVIPSIYSLSVPSGATLLDNDDGTAQFDWLSVPPLSGTTYMAVIATDDWQADSLVIGIAINQGPSISSDCGDATLAEDQPYDCVITANDPDNPGLAIIWNGVPSDASFIDHGDGTADFSFMPGPTDVGSAYTAVFRVDDGLSSAADSVTIDVVNRQLTVLSMQPSPGADDDVLITDSIRIQFNEAVNPVSLASNLAFSSARGTPLGYHLVPSQNHVLIAASSGNFGPLDTIGVTINAGLQDLAGYLLDQTYTETFVTGTAVFPGDANRDGIVDGRDILPMGLFWGNTGPARNQEPDLSWSMSPGHAAFGGSRWSPWRGAYADADGSGMIDPNDICGVTDNYSLTHMISENTKDHERSLVTSLDMVEQSVLHALYQAVIDCPESQGRSELKESLEAALGQSASVEALPTRVELYQNYPNPFNPLTTIRFYLPTSGRARLSVYNLLGRHVATLINGQVGGGYIEATWDGTDDNGNAVASGIYFYRLEAGGFNETRRMMLLK